MYRENDLMNCLFGLVGFRQNNNPDYPTLSDTLVQSDTGLYIQDEQPLLTIENLDQAFKNYDKFNYPAFSISVPYDIGAKVRASDGKVYESQEAGNTGNDPVSSPSEWEEVPLLSQALEAVHKASINKIFARVFSDKKINQVTKSIFENIQIFDGAGSLLNKEIKAGRFVGFEVILRSHRDLSLVLRRLGTQFTAVNGDFKLYVFHSSQLEPIKIFNLALTRANSFEWTNLLDEGSEYVLRYLGDHSPGGSFYIGYYEDELTGQAINKGYNFGVAPICSTCNNDFRYWSAWSEFIEVSPIEINSSDLAGITPADGPGGAGIPHIWDIAVNRYPSTKNYGLNFDMSVKCDVTDFFCRERRLFTDVILKQVCVDLLTHIAYNTRNNVIAKETRDLAMYELNNKQEHTPGAGAKLENALKALSFDISNLNDACLPPNEKYGSTWSSF